MVLPPFLANDSSDEAKANEVRVRFLKSSFEDRLHLKSDSHLSKKICIICLIESPLKVMKNAFYFILKALFVLKIFKFLSRFFGHVGKTA